MTFCRHSGPLVNRQPRTDHYFITPVEFSFNIRTGRTHLEMYQYLVCPNNSIIEITVKILNIGTCMSEQTV